MVNDHDRRLAEALDRAGYPPSIVDKARQGHWSDFKTPLAFPKLELVTFLERDGHRDLADRVKQGEFDG